MLSCISRMFAALIKQERPWETACLFLDPVLMMASKGDQHSTRAKEMATYLTCMNIHWGKSSSSSSLLVQPLTGTLAPQALETHPLVWTRPCNPLDFWAHKKHSLSSDKAAHTCCICMLRHLLCDCDCVCVCASAHWAIQVSLNSCLRTHNDWSPERPSNMPTVRVFRGLFAKFLHNTNKPFTALSSCIIMQ